MKTIVMGSFGLLIVASAIRVLFANSSEIQPGDAPSPTTAPASAPTTAASSGDAGTDLVVAFYKALLQEAPPTLEQENSLFNSSGSRTRLVAAGLGKDKDPVVLEFIRKHKDSFLPKQMRLDYVGVSSTFHWIRDLDHMKDPPKKGYGYVLATFVEDREAKHMKTRTIVFGFSEGKIDVDGIRFDGIGSKMLLEEVLKIKVKGDPLDPAEFKGTTTVNSR
jgi:hypothetical protein